MPNHPKPDVLADHLNRVAETISEHGLAALELAPQLAARGYPTATIGNGSRSSSDTTSTERAAGTDTERERDTRWDAIDQRLATYLRLIWKAGLDLETLITDIVAHASDIDILPAGTGSCVCCTTLVRPTAKHPDNRLRSGLCPTCHSAWQRFRSANRGDRGTFIAARKRQLEAANQPARTG
jgi:hypothetical protein